MPAAARSLSVGWEDAPILMHADCQCVFCCGSGRRAGGSVCKCVFRSVFRTALARYRACQERLNNGGSHPSLRGRHGHGWTWGFPDAEYCADFERLALEKAPRHAQIFLRHILGDVEGRDCATRMGISAGDFWHRVYEFHEALGERMLGYLYPLRRVSARENAGLPTSALGVAA